jgi:hypothetical protein
VMSKFNLVSKLLAAIALAITAAPACAQSKTAQLVLADPFVVQAGMPTKVTLRGLRLDGVTAARCHEPKSMARLLGKPGKASGVDPKFANQIGDMQIEIEVTAAPDSVGGDISVSVVTSTGESSPLRLLVDDGSPVVAEKEPNNGFRQAQPISLPQTIAGGIQHPQDVDLFRFEGKAGEHLLVKVFAARYGSPLDPLLTLYDAGGQVVTTSDDTPRSENLRLHLTLPKSGIYFLSLGDANDQGGPLFKYRLSIERGK